MNIFKQMHIWQRQNDLLGWSRISEGVAYKPSTLYPGMLSSKLQNVTPQTPAKEDVLTKQPERN